MKNDKIKDRKVMITGIKNNIKNIQKLLESPHWGIILKSDVLDNLSKGEKLYEILKSQDFSKFQNLTKNIQDTDKVEVRLTKDGQISFIDIKFELMTSDWDTFNTTNFPIDEMNIKMLSLTEKILQDFIIKNQSKLFDAHKEQERKKAEAKFLKDTFSLNDKNDKNDKKSSIKKNL
jgi:hypothetical protein